MCTSSAEVGKEDTVRKYMYMSVCICMYICIHTHIQALCFYMYMIAIGLYKELLYMYTQIENTIEITEYY